MQIDPVDPQQEFDDLFVRLSSAGRGRTASRAGGVFSLDALMDMTGIPKSRARPHNSNMIEPLTRPELDAKLETIEARMDGRLARIEDRFAAMDETMRDIKTMVHNQRKTIWGAAATTIALVLAAMALFVSSFDSGRDTAKTAADAQAIAAQAQQETAAALTQIRQIVSDLRAAQPPQK